jgi:fumarate hydratase subunit alpha
LKGEFKLREINVSEIIAAVRKLCIDANYYLSDDIRQKLEEAYKEEDWSIAKDILGKILVNAGIAKNENMPMCQDTGMTCVFIDLGQEVHIIGGSLEDAINEGVRQGYADGYLRKSVVKDPLNRVNTGDNTPAVINYNIVSGDKIKITVSPKGFGSENMSKLKMLRPADGIEGVKNFVLQTVKEAGPNPCPPIIVGVGIGGTFEKSAIIAKKSLLRPVTQRNGDPFYAELEKELLDKINALGIGPQGFGGRTTALCVNIETYPTHIAGLPVAVNISCHATRHAEIEL